MRKTAQQEREEDLAWDLRIAALQHALDHRLALHRLHLVKKTRRPFPRTALTRQYRLTAQLAHKMLAETRVKKTATSGRQGAHGLDNWPRGRPRGVTKTREAPLPLAHLQHPDPWPGLDLILRRRDQAGLPRDPQQEQQARDLLALTSWRYAYRYKPSWDWLPRSNAYSGDSSWEPQPEAAIAGRTADR